MEDQAFLDMVDVGVDGEEQDIDQEAEVIAEGMSQSLNVSHEIGADSVRLWASAHGMKWHEALLTGIADAMT